MSSFCKKREHLVEHVCMYVINHQLTLVARTCSSLSVPDPMPEPETNYIKQIIQSAYTVSPLWCCGSLHFPSNFIPSCLSSSVQRIVYRIVIVYVYALHLAGPPHRWVARPWRPGESCPLSFPCQIALEAWPPATAGIMYVLPTTSGGTVRSSALVLSLVLAGSACFLRFSAEIQFFTSSLVLPVKRMASFTRGEVLLLIPWRCRTSHTATTCGLCRGAIMAKLLYCLPCFMQVSESMPIQSFILGHQNRLVDARIILLSFFSPTLAVLWRWMHMEIVTTHSLIQQY